MKLLYGNRAIFFVIRVVMYGQRGTLLEYRIEKILCLRGLSEKLRISVLPYSAL